MTIKLSTRTGFAAIPNDFLQDKNISIEAKGTAAFLQSLPEGWRVQAWYVQRELNYGERVWQKVAKELKDCGYLKYYPGGLPGGSHYEFNIWQYETKLIEPGNDKMSAPGGNDKMSAPLKSGARKMSSHINKLDPKKETNTQKQINNTPIPPKGDFLTLDLITETFERWWDQYPNKKGKEKAFISFRKLCKNLDMQGLEGLLMSMMDGLVSHIHEEYHHREIAKLYPDMDVFYPTWPHGSTWINQKRWLDVYETDGDKIYEKLRRQQPAKQKTFRFRTSTV